MEEKMNVVLDKKPNIPRWFYYQPNEIITIDFQAEDKVLFLESANSSIMIFPYEGKGGGWSVRIRINYGADSYTESQRIFTKGELEQAFGLAKECFLAKLPRKFIRVGNFLNIPEPGTGQKGDPSASIYLSIKVKEAIEKILEY